MLKLSAVEPATDAAIQTKKSKKKKKNGSGTITLIIANEEMNVMKILKPLEESGLLIEDVSQTIKNEAKKQKVGPLGMLLSTLGASLWENVFAGKVVKRPKSSNIRRWGIVRAGEWAIIAGEGTITVGQDF